MTGLPLDGAFGRDIGAHRPGWGNVEELLAGLIETVDVGNRVLYMANAKKGTRAPKPLKITRPGDREAERPKMATSAEMARFFGRKGPPPPAAP